MPVPVSLPISQLLSRCVQDYTRLKEKSLLPNVRAKKIFIRDKFEIVDHSQLVGNCFEDFMEVTVKAMLNHTHLPTSSSKPVITAAPQKIDLAKA